MISEKTLFILGAGASNPYGYPVGAGLRRFIIKDFPSLIEKYIHSETETMTQHHRRVHREEANRFSETFSKSSLPSVDLFIALNPEFADIGRKAIAIFISRHEVDSVFREDVAEEDGDWYLYLYQKNGRNVYNTRKL